MSVNRRLRESTKSLVVQHVKRAGWGSGGVVSSPSGTRPGLEPVSLATAQRFMLKYSNSLVESGWKGFRSKSKSVKKKKMKSFPVFPRVLEEHVEDI